MPPKREKSLKSKDAKEKDDGTGGQAAVLAEAEKAVVERELVIQQLQAKLRTTDERCSMLFQENEKLLTELEEARARLSDITAFLNLEVKKKDAKIVESEAQSSEALEEANTKRAQLAKDLADVKAASGKEVTDLKDKLEMGERKLQELREFSEKKGQLEEELAEARATMAKMKVQHEDAVGDLERKSVQEKDNLKKEITARVQETEQAMRKLTEEQLDITTKRTILENEQMSIELAYQSRQTEKLLARFNRVSEENAAFKRQQELSKQTEEDLAKRSHLYQKTIRTLLTKIEAQDATTHDEATHLQQLVEENSGVFVKVQQLEQELRAATRELESLRALHSRRAAEIEQLKAQDDDALHFLSTCLGDIRGQMDASKEKKGEVPCTEGRGGSEVCRLQELSLEQRHTAIEYLMRRLAGFQALKKAQSSGKGRESSILLIGSGRLNQSALPSSISELLSLPTSSVYPSKVSHELIRVGGASPTKNVCQQPIPNERNIKAPEKDLVSQIKEDERPWGKITTGPFIGTIKDSPTGRRRVHHALSQGAGR